MALSAFKSTSKRGNLTTNSSSSRPNIREREPTEKSSKRVPPRRSRSVSAVSRSLDAVSEFHNKRDNPLFCSNSSSGGDGFPLPDNGEIKLKNVVKIDEIRIGSGEDRESGRGRSVARNADGKKSLAPNRKEIGQSLSRVDTGRRIRSASVRPMSRYQSESEVEQESGTSVTSNFRTSDNSNTVTSNARNVIMDKNSSELLNGMKSLRTWSSQHPSFEPSYTSSSDSCLHTPKWDHGGMMASAWEAEEKTIKAVSEKTKEGGLGDDTPTSGIYEIVRSEVRRAISDIQIDPEIAFQRNISTVKTSRIDTPVDPESPGAVDLVLDIRREYARELDESHERARKLRADLAVEEQRGQELSRILKELLSEPKTSNVQRKRPERKNSIERRRMSRTLAEEAMTYFDECVSISTFDGSDFSSQEDPPFNLYGDNAGNLATLPEGNSNALNPNKETDTLQGSRLKVSTSNDNVLTSDKTISSDDDGHLEQDCKFLFSFSEKPDGNFGSYVKQFEKGSEKKYEIGPETTRSNRFDIDEYNFGVPAHSFLLDRFKLKNRVESGSILLCGDFPVSDSPFAFMF